MGGIGAAVGWGAAHELTRGDLRWSALPGRQGLQRQVVDRLALGVAERVIDEAVALQRPQARDGRGDVLGLEMHAVVAPDAHLGVRHAGKDQLADLFSIHADSTGKELTMYSYNTSLSDLELHPVPEVRLDMSAQPRVVPATVACDAESLARTGRRVFEVEARALEAVRQRINGDFHRACQLLLDCRGRVVVSGMGKSGHVGNKIAATLASTGTPAFFVHPGE